MLALPSTAFSRWCASNFSGGTEVGKMTVGTALSSSEMCWQAAFFAETRKALQLVA